MEKQYVRMLSGEKGTFVMFNGNDEGAPEEAPLNYLDIIDIASPL